MRLPVSLQRRLRGLPQWSPVGLNLPQEAVQVRMSGAGGEFAGAGGEFAGARGEFAGARGEFDITGGVVVASLRPLTLAVCLNEQTRPAVEDPSGSRLRFVDLRSGHTVGLLHLRHVRNWDATGITIAAFEIHSGTQQCLRWPYRPLNQWLQNRSMLKNTDPANFSMPPEAVQQLMIFYICPRPVVLVSVDDGSHNNVFPMDLIGPVSADRFTLALRSTSQSVATMKSSRRVVLSDIAARAFGTAYKLGAHHKNIKVDWASLPFGIRRSRDFALPYPDIALRVREVEILDFDTIGSHTFFVTRIASEVPVADEPRFFHTCGLYQHFRTRRGYPFPAAAAAL
jgi:flavin reductase (DIM6/NTAB) family NADH-FMN oxidoreductase RutF